MFMAIQHVISRPPIGSGAHYTAFRKRQKKRREPVILYSAGFKIVKVKAGVQVPGFSAVINRSGLWQ